MKRKTNYINDKQYEKNEFLSHGSGHDASPLFL